MSNFSDQAKAIIAAVAPTIGTAFGGPLGTAAGIFVANALGTKKADGSVDHAATDAMLAAGNPDTMLKLRQAEMDFQAHLDQLGFDRDKLVYQDVADARARDTAYIRANTHNWRADFLAAAAMVTFGWALYQLFTVDLPVANRELTVYLLGALTVIVKDLYGFEFGSSKSSQEKNELLFNSTPTTKK